MKRILLVVSVLFLAACVRPVVATLSATCAASGSDIVCTEQGAVRGVVEGEMLAFKGIPYARPPIGAQRWRPPDVAEPWHGVRDGSRYGSMCPQIIGKDVKGEEDCLFINVWRPREKPAQPLPVMVWLTGGGNHALSGEGSGIFGGVIYNGAKLVPQGVIFVSYNPRLGALGFLAHSALDAERPEKISGNYGSLDQIAMLRWLKRNIGAFGGDPSKIFLFGTSAGGGIEVARAEPGPFSDNEIELLKTFADQAVIAVENVRLFKELQARTGELTRSVDQLTALGEISQAVSSTLDVETVLQTIVSRASQLAGADGCAIYEYDDATEAFHIRATHNLDPVLVETLRAAPLRKGEGAMGRAAETRAPTQVADIAAPGAYQSHPRDTLLGAGYRALLSVPLLREGEIIGSLSLNRHTPGEFPPEAVEVLKTFATQSALAIQNARLFREIADKSAQLEAASRHKSEFLANMSHELRTPLNAIIGFSEVLAEKMFGDVNDKQAEYLQDILESGRHLLSLINDILDLSKIEAGRMELEASEFDLPQAIENALTLVRERALRRGIALHHIIDDRVADIRADERKVKQVLLNLLSNAIKFTPEGGRIEVRAAPVGGTVEVSVTDTGVGIAQVDQEAVFEEFRQVGTADKKAEGTGLGLALSRKFIELHGGQIRLMSQVGVGSTFTFTLPIR